MLAGKMPPMPKAAKNRQIQVPVRLPPTGEQEDDLERHSGEKTSSQAPAGTLQQASFPHCAFARRCASSTLSSAL